MHTWIRSAIVVIAIALVGIVGVWQAGNLVAERGTLGPSVLQSISPTFALLALVITIGVGALAGGLVAKISTTTTGMFIYGFAICAMAMRLEGATEFVTNEGNYSMLLFEALLMSVLVLLGTIGRVRYRWTNYMCTTGRQTRFNAFATGQDCVDIARGSSCIMDFCKLAHERSSLRCFSCKRNRRWAFVSSVPEDFSTVGIVWHCPSLLLAQAILSAPPWVLATLQH